MHESWGTNSNLTAEMQRKSASYCSRESAYFLCFLPSENILHVEIKLSTALALNLSILKNKKTSTNFDKRS